MDEIGGGAVGVGITNIEQGEYRISNGGVAAGYFGRLGAAPPVRYSVFDIHLFDIL